MTSCRPSASWARSRTAWRRGRTRRRCRPASANTEAISARRGSCRRACTSAARVWFCLPCRWFRIPSWSSPTRPRRCRGRRRPRCPRPPASREHPTEDQFDSDSCQLGAGKIVLQPPPPAPSPFQTVSPAQVLAGAEFQPRAPDGHDVGGGGRKFDRADPGVPVEVAVVAGRGGDHRAGVVEGARRLVGRGAFLGAALGVRDLGRAEALGGVLGGFEVQVDRFAGLHQQDVAGLADGVGGLDVERDLEPPAVASSAFSTSALLPLHELFEFAEGFRERQVAGFAVLVDLPEATVFGRAGGQREVFVVGPQVGFGRRVVVGVHDRDGLGRRGAGGERVGGVEVLGAQAEVAGGGRGGRGLADAGSPSGCRWARAAAERATSTLAMQLTRPGSGVSQTRLVSYSPGRARRCRCGPRPRARRAVAASRRTATHASARRSGHATMVARRMSKRGECTLRRLVGRRAAALERNLRRRACGPMGGPAGRPGSRNGIVTAWSRLAHEPRRGRGVICITGELPRPDQPGSAWRDERRPVQCAQNGAAPRRRPVRHLRCRQGHVEVVWISDRQESAVTHGRGADRGGAGRAVHADRLCPRPGRARRVAVGGLPARGAAGVDHLGGVARVADGRR